MEINEPINSNIPEIASGEERKGITREGVIGLVFALCLLVASYFILEIFPVMFNPLGFLIITVAVYLITTVVAVLLGARPGFFSIAAMVLGIVTALYRFVHGYVDFDLFPIIFIAGIFYAYYVLSLFSNHSKSLGGGLLLDFVKGIVYMFISFHEFFLAIFKPRGSKRKPFTVLLVLGAIVITAIFVVIVVALLSYDPHFTKLLPKLDIDEAVEKIIKAFFAVPLAAMLFSVMASSIKKKLPSLSKQETVSKVGSKVKVIPAILFFMPVIALLIVYVLFFISQWAYYMSAFTHTLPDNYSAAEYAREGFFQLCAVTFVNLFLIFLMNSFMRNRTKASDVTKRVLTILLCTATLILIATAISKMFLYIDRYDLTRSRLEVTVFMFFLATVVIAVLIWAIFKKVKVLPIIVVSAALFFTAYSLTNTNRIIAKYNVDSYLSGKHDSIDVDYLRNDLGYSSVPELKRLYENASGEVKDNAHKAYLDLKDDAYGTEWYEGEIPYYIAKKTFNMK